MWSACVPSANCCLGGAGPRYLTWNFPPRRATSKLLWKVVERRQNKTCESGEKTGANSLARASTEAVIGWLGSARNANWESGREFMLRLLWERGHAREKWKTHMLLGGHAVVPRGEARITICLCVALNVVGVGCKCNAASACKKLLNIITIWAGTWLSSASDILCVVFCVYNYRKWLEQALGIP